MNTGGNISNPEIAVNVRNSPSCTSFKFYGAANQHLRILFINDFTGDGAILGNQKSRKNEENNRKQKRFKHSSDKLYDLRRKGLSIIRYWGERIL